MEKGVSIIINNYNYGRYLATAIESVLRQTVPPLELIVVDDGSTDNSGDIIDQYKGRLQIIMKQNGGQASSFNAGFSKARGEWIWFLDADDWLADDAVEQLSSGTLNDFVKIQGTLLIANEKGEVTNKLVPAKPLSSGTVISEILEIGDYVWPPTTGNIFSRKLLEACMPVPEEQFRISADFYLCSYAGVKGKIKALKKPLGFYRVHGHNNFYGPSLDPSKLLRTGNLFLTVADRTETLVTTELGMTNFKYPYSRRFLESLMLANRLGGLQIPIVLTNNIHRYWKRSLEVKSLTGKSKLKAISFWFLLRFAPKSIVLLTARYLQNKHHKVQSIN